MKLPRTSPVHVFMLAATGGFSIGWFVNAMSTVSSASTNAVTSTHLLSFKNTFQKLVIVKPEVFSKCCFVLLMYLVICPFNLVSSDHRS